MAEEKLTIISKSAKVLTADLRYVLASSVAAGDILVGFDENRKPSRRRFSSSSVISVRESTGIFYRLSFEDGTVVECSENHNWLRLRHGGDTGHGRTCNWGSTKSMVETKGLRLGSSVAKPLEVWESGRTYSDGYLAAALDGEGCLTHHIISNPCASTATNLVFTQTENKMLHTFMDMLKEIGVKFRFAMGKKKNDRWKPTGRVYISGRKDILKLIGRCRPVRILAKLKIDMLGAIPTRVGSRVVKKRVIGETSGVEIITTCGTLIVNGFASHDCRDISIMGHPNKTQLWALSRTTKKWSRCPSGTNCSTMICLKNMGLVEVRFAPRYANSKKRYYPGMREWRLTSLGAKATHLALKKPEVFK